MICDSQDLTLRRIVFDEVVTVRPRLSSQLLVCASFGSKSTNYIREMVTTRQSGIIQCGIAPIRDYTFNKTVVTRYRISLESRGLAAGTINGRLAAVRRLAYEAADSR
jgi:hypothetical protein